MFNRSIRNAAAPLVGLAALALGGYAQAETASARSHGPAMALGDAALPPIGFLDLCQRLPAECADDPAAIPDLTTLRAEANRRFWQDAFARRPNAPAALGDAPPAFDWSRAFEVSARARRSAVPVSVSLTNRGPARLAQAVEAQGPSADVAATMLGPVAQPRIDASSVPNRSSSHLRLGPPRPFLNLARGRGATGFAAASRRHAIVTSPADGQGALAAGDVAVAALDTGAAPMVETLASAAGDGVMAANDGVMAAAVPAIEAPAAPGVATEPLTSMSTSTPVPDLGQATFALDRSGWTLVNGVNRRVNRQIRRMADDRQYGQADYWARPEGPRARGDCEDYVLAKRRALIAAGVPAAALSIAIVETGWGETHAVLLLASDEGEFVLDNLSPWVSRWDRVNYTWRERQRPGRPFDWVRAAI